MNRTPQRQLRRLLWTAIALIATLTAFGLVLLGTQATSDTYCSLEKYEQKPLLGPANLPSQGPLGAQFVGYDPVAGQDPAAFLNSYYNDSSNKWNYPLEDGYRIVPQAQANGTKIDKPITWRQVLQVGQYVDRFGAEGGGRFLSPTGLSYSSRALPPTNLNGDPAWSCNYHNYQVRKPFAVDAGPIAPGFGQPGGGLQFKLNAELDGAPVIPKDTPGETLDVLWLVNNGYLARV